MNLKTKVKIVLVFLILVSCVFCKKNDNVDLVPSPDSDTMETDTMEMDSCLNNNL